VQSVDPHLHSQVDRILDSLNVSHNHKNTNLDKKLDLIQQFINVQKQPFSTINWVEFSSAKQEFRDAIDRYIQMHNAMINGSSTRRKFIVLSLSGQLCNRIRGTVSGFALALLTNRALLIPKFLYGETVYSDLFKDPGFAISANVPKGIRSNRFIQVGDNGGMKMVEFFTCADLLDEDAYPEDIWTISGSNYYATYLARNPFLQKRLESLFLDDDIYRPILFYLFRPLEQIVEMKNAFVKKHLSSNKFLVSFHIRSEYPISEDEWTAYRECATHVTPSLYENSVSWFVSTDSSASRKKVLSTLSKDVIFYSPDEFIVGGKKAGLVQALVDILIASEGNRIFLTPHSSFSKVISLYAKTPHVYMVSDFGIPEQDPHRVFTNISRNCFRFHRKEDCVWHGHLKTTQDMLTQVSCYNPGMKTDYCG
jgi:hypothetical protein